MKTLIGDKVHLSEIKIIEREFFIVFKEGIPLIPDKINLASQEALQCIEDALGSETINNYNTCQNIQRNTPLNQ